MSERTEISLLGATEIREIAHQLGVVPSKSLGQNFVHDSNICEKIVRLAGITHGDVVVEIGPGLGSLSLSIARTGAHLIAVEVDARLASRLPETLRAHGVKADAFMVITKDAMQLSSQDLGLAQDSGRAIKVVANLPYNVSVPVLIHLLEMERFESAMVMVQSEVARRLAAKPGSREYGVPSAKVAWFADATLSDSIPRAVFWPVPRVDSLLLQLQVHQPLSNEADRHLTFEIIDAAFNQRRKMLRSSLSRLLEEHVPELAVEVILERAGLDPTARAESISVEGFLAIARVIRSTHP